MFCGSSDPHWHVLKLVLKWSIIRPSTLGPITHAMLNALGWPDPFLCGASGGSRWLVALAGVGCNLAAGMLHM